MDGTVEGPGDIVVEDETRTFGDRSFRIRRVLTDTEPDLRHVTTAIGIAFEGDSLLLVEHAKYGGLQPPGGHIEPGETAVEAVRREVLEEGSVEVGAARLIGYEEITPLFEVPTDYGYPVPSYQLFYSCRIDRVLPFNPNAESVGRQFLDPVAARAAWASEAAAFYDNALEVSRALAR